MSRRSKRPAVTRRDALSLLGAAGAASFIAACGGDSKKTAASSSSTSSSTTEASTTTSTTPSAAVSCVLTPEQAEGPYYIDGEAFRSDITEGRPGVALRLPLTVVDASTCKPIAGATVEIWHADAGGNYSGFGSTTSNRTFLRGQQKTGTDGVATFKTIYPGWYQGRVTHIHTKVHAGGSTVHTGQLFFDDAVSQSVFGNSPYNSRGSGYLNNAQDGIYNGGGSKSILKLTKEGNGYVGTLTMGVRS